QSLQVNGVRIEHVLTQSNVSSGVAQITVSDAGENHIVVIPGANALVGGENLKTLDALLPTCSTLLMQLEIPLETVIEAARLAHANHIPIILDPAPAQPLPAELYPLIDIITPNQTEAKLLTNHSTQTLDETKQAAEILLRRGVRQVIIKMGSA